MGWTPGAPRRMIAAMDEKITVRHTETGRTMEVVVFSRRAEAIEVVIGQGMNNMKCVLTPTRNGLAYAGSVLGQIGRAHV